MSHHELHHDQCSMNPPDGAFDRECDDWFLPFILENLAQIIVVLLAIVCLIQGSVLGGFMTGVALCGIVAGGYFRGREGLAVIGAGVGFLLGGWPGLPWGLALGWFDGWILGMDRQKMSAMLKPLGWINGVVISGVIGFAGARENGIVYTLQWFLAMGLYGWIGGFVAEVIPAFLNFVGRLGVNQG